MFFFYNFLDKKNENFQIAIQELMQHTDTTFLKDLLTLCHPQATYQQIRDAKDDLSERWGMKDTEILLIGNIFDSKQKNF